MLISFLFNNWKNLIWSFACCIIIAAVYGLFYHLKTLNNEIYAKQNIIKQQKQIINDQLIKYKIAQEQNNIKESIIYSYNESIEISEVRYANLEKQINLQANNLDITNVITPYWLRLATGASERAKVPAISNAASSINGKIESTIHSSPSRIASALNEYILSCNILQDRYNALIDYISLTSVNYNKQLSDNMVK